MAAYYRPGSPDSHHALMDRHNDFPRHKRGMPAVPDLSFERTYIKSIKPYIHMKVSETHADGDGQTTELLTRTKEAEVLRIDWGMILWVTFRDQLLPPFLQGAAWGLWQVHLVPRWQKYKLAYLAWWRRGDNIGVRRVEGGGVWALRSWVSNLLTVNNTTGPVTPSRHSI
ncbi:hypothetical protein BC835DRAFT_1422879 [Cytidiella melzeri]|nr:hypothetical protein BC835DRAFT_1422879 [Cytidiella melzeri]